MGQGGGGRGRSAVPRSFWTRAAYSFGLIAAVLALGTVAMHFIEGWSYLDAFYFTSFIATGQGPPATLNPATELGKFFAAILAFVSVGTVITALLFLFGPFLGRLLKAGEKEIEKLEREIEGKPEPSGSADVPVGVEPSSHLGRNLAPPV